MAGGVAMVEFKFQSTHPRRVRPLWNDLSLFRFGRFNPRTHVGCDFVLVCAPAANSKFQSTHPRRVRLTKEVDIATVGRFQSTHPRRVRLAVTQEVVLQVVFQSTHPRRVRLATPMDMGLMLSFNPRTHVGCDFLVLPLRSPKNVSIHAPT